MKTILIIIAFLLFATFNMFATIDCWIHYRVPQNTGYWAYNDYGKCCTIGGTNCIIVPCDHDPRLGSIEPLLTGGWLIHGSFDGTTLQREVNNVWIDVEREGSYYTFLTPEKLVIDDCDTYPELENIQLELEGITTDGNGNFTIYVPAIQ